METDYLVPKEKYFSNRPKMEENPEQTSSLHSDKGQGSRRESLNRRHRLSFVCLPLARTSVTWPHPTARKAGKCNVFGRGKWTQFGGMFLKISVETGNGSTK